MKHWNCLLKVILVLQKQISWKKKNEMTNENNCSQYNHRSVDNNVDHCNNPTIVRDKLSNIVTTL